MADDTRPYAFVTLVTSDVYLPGALVVAHALKDVHPRPPEPPEVDFQTVCLVTPETVDVSSIRTLRKAFDLVVGVEIIDQQLEGAQENLGLLGRRDLTTVLTKIHVFRLTQFKKVIYLDADTLPLRPISHLFTLPHKLAAAPDSGWPDIFNSGVMVIEPSQQSFEELSELAKLKGSWDGGDQGLLNDWAGDNWHRISFTYNTTPTAAYTYKPAYARFHDQIKLLHFIGSHKPWGSLPIRPSRPLPGHLTTTADTSYAALVDQWYAVYDKHYRPLAGDTSILPDPSDEPSFPGAGEPSLQEAATFLPPYYASVWDEPTSAQEQPSAERGPHVLDELRDLAIKGLGSMYPAQEGEGKYESLPIDGRVDLMRPRPEEAPVGDEDETPKAHPPPPPAPAPPVQTGEYPPYLQHQPPPPPPPSGPSGEEYFPPQEPPPPEEPPQQEQQQEHAHVHFHPAVQAWEPPAEQPPQEHRQDASYYQELHVPPEEHTAPLPPPPPFSPPHITWNPAYEPPPTDPPPSSVPFPEWTGNTWDQAPASTQEFFYAPPPPDVPRHLVEEGMYGSMIGHAPDPSKVRDVFPWESQPRVQSHRVWPRGGSPPPGLPELKPTETHDLSDLAGPRLEVQGPTPPGSSPQVHLPSPQKQPQVGLPTDMTFRNAWDTDPHIQKYVSKLVRPDVGSRQNSYLAMRRSPLSTPGIKGNFTFRRPRERGEGADASSRDGDDEEDEEDVESEGGAEEMVDSEEEEGLSQDRGAGRRTPPRGKAGPVSTGGAEAGGHSTKTYRSQAVQTDPPPKTKSRGVQVGRTDFFAPRLPRQDEGTQTTIQPAAPRRPSLAETPMPVPDTQYLLPQQQLPATPSPYDDMTLIEDSGVSLGGGYRPEQGGKDDSRIQDSTDAFASYFPASEAVESPREVAVGPVPHIPGLEPVASELLPIQPLLRPGPVVLPPHVRLSSNETQTTSGSSPPSTILMSPKDDEINPRLSPRASVRRWDPARDVDIFKRDSQEVLARFLRMNEMTVEDAQEAH